LIYSDEKRLAVACILGNLLETQTQRLKLCGIKHVALEQDNCSNTVITDQSCDFFVNLTAVKANSK
jgi:hypothetical protein